MTSAQLRRSTSLTLVACLAFAMVGCSFVRSLPVRMISGTLDDLGTSLYKQTDLQLAKDGLPAFLLLLDGLLESDSDNSRLLMSAAQAYSAYAMAFVEDEDPERAVKLYWKARNYAARVLWRSNKRIKEAWDKPFEEFAAAVAKAPKKDVPALFWTASCWASWISANTDSVDALADLSMVECLMRRALELDETYQYGGPHLFMGVYHAVRPKQLGGDLRLARKHFERAAEIAGPDYLIAKVYFAKYYARLARDLSLLLNLDEIQVWPGFCAKLANEGKGPSPGPSRRIWELMPPEAQAIVQRDDLDRGAKRAVVRALNDMLLTKDFYEFRHFESVALPSEAKALLARERGELSGEQVQRLNRLLLEAAYPSEIAKSLWNKGLYREMLEEVLAATVDEKSDLALLNTVAKDRAATMLDLDEDDF